MLMLSAFGDVALMQEDLVARLAWLRDVVGPRLERYLGYYRNPTTDLSAILPCATTASFAVRPFRQYQELGLPARITGFRRAADGAAVATGPIDFQRKEVVIENDIAWRINTLVDFVAARVPSITSTAPNAALRVQLTQVINELLSGHDDSIGGLLQELALQGAVCGSAWVQLRPTTALLIRLARQANNGENGKGRVDGSGMGGNGEKHDGGGAGAVTPDLDNESLTAAAGRDVTRLDQWMQLEVVEAARLCPLSHAQEQVQYAAVLTHRVRPAEPARAGLLDKVRSWFVRPTLAADAEEFSFDLFGPDYWQRYQRGDLVEEGANLLGAAPFVRYENAADPAAGKRVGPAGSAAVDVGLGEVEPLIGLQDELNTRLSDRAYRVTMTSFRMYLGRGIEDFVKRPVGPGQMWATDNPQASIESFGGDANTPSESAHVEEVREALDKISGVSPVAAGLIRGKLGNLTSAVALRLTLIALLARTARKRAALERTLAAVVRMALAVLDRAGILRTAEEDRGIDVNWPTALPESDMDRLQEAQAKLALGVPQEIVLMELGYGELELEGGTGSKTPALTPEKTQT